MDVCPVAVELSAPRLKGYGIGEIIKRLFEVSLFCLGYAAVIIYFCGLRQQAQGRGIIPYRFLIITQLFIGYASVIVGLRVRAADHQNARVVLYGFSSSALFIVSISPVVKRFNVTRIE